VNKIIIISSIFKSSTWSVSLAFTDQDFVWI